MNKLALVVEDLAVESFVIDRDAAVNGTVHANEYGKNSIYNCKPEYSDSDSRVGRTCRASCDSCRAGCR